MLIKNIKKDFNQTDTQALIPHGWTSLPNIFLHFFLFFITKYIGRPIFKCIFKYQTIVFWSEYSSLIFSLFFSLNYSQISSCLSMLHISAIFSMHNSHQALKWHQTQTAVTTQIFHAQLALIKRKDSISTKLQGGEQECARLSLMYVKGTQLP